MANKTLRNNNFESKIKRSAKFLRKNYIISIFLACILFVGFIVVAKSVVSKTTYVYVKVKVGQGYWWVSSARPNIWYVNSIKKGDIAKDLLGNNIAQILNKRYYRYYSGDQYDAYLTLKLKAGYNKRTNQYTYDRSILSVASPIDVQFPQVDVSGVVISLSTKPFDEKEYEKTIYLSKRYAFPWEFEAINVGDSTFDGEDEIFKILDKQNIETSNITTDVYGTSNPTITEPKMYITVKAMVKLKKIGDQWILGEDQVISLGRNISISTPNLEFDGYLVSKIE